MKPAAADLLPPGLREPVHGAQRAFRLLLDAIAHPGRIHDLRGLVAAPPPAPLGEAAAALLLALCDLDTPLWLLPQGGPALSYLAFHCGVPAAAASQAAAFAYASDPALLPAFEEFALGSDEYPDRSTTLLLEVPNLVSGDGVVLSGPGIERRARFTAGGLDMSFWCRRQALAALFPRGLDIVFTCGALVAALPRSTNVEIP